MPTQTSALKIMRAHQHVKGGPPSGVTIMLFRSRDAQDTFELQVTPYQSTWFFSRRDFNFLRPDIEAAGVSYCVAD